MSIKVKIGIIFFIFFVELITFSSLYFFLFKQHKQEMEEIQDEIVEMDLLRDLQISLSMVVMPANDYLIEGAQINEKENFIVLSAKVEDLISKIEKLEFDKIEEGQLVNHIKAEYTKAKDIASKIFSISNAVGNKEAGALMEELDSLIDLTISECDQFRKIALQEIEEAEDSWQRLITLLNTIIFTGVILTVILIIGSLFFFNRTITSPLISLRDAAMEVGRGNLEKKVDISSGDEIGDLSISFNKMVEDLRTLIDKEKEISKHREEALFSYEQNMRNYESEIKNLRLEINSLLQTLGRPRKY